MIFCRAHTPRTRALGKISRFPFESHLNTALSWNSTVDSPYTHSAAPPVSLWAASPFRMRARARVKTSSQTVASRLGHHAFLRRAMFIPTCADSDKS